MGWETLYKAEEVLSRIIMYGSPMVKRIKNTSMHRAALNNLLSMSM